MSLVKSTNLSNISINSISIGEKITDADLINYNSEIVIRQNDDESVTFLKSDFNSTSKITINQKLDFTTIEDVKEVLGNSYYEMVYDYSQSLNEYIYFDRANNITAKFIFIKCDGSENDGFLNWIIIYKSK